MSLAIPADASLTGASPCARAGARITTAADAPITNAPRAMPAWLRAMIISLLDLRTACHVVLWSSLRQCVPDNTSSEAMLNPDIQESRSGSNERLPDVRDIVDYADSIGQLARIDGADWDIEIGVLAEIF